MENIHNSTEALMLNSTDFLSKMQKMRDFATKTVKITGWKSDY